MPARTKAKPANRAKAHDATKEIYAALKAMISKCCPPCRVTTDTTGKFETYGTRAVEAYGKTMEGIYFASAVPRQGKVSFYFFPIYTHPMEVGPVTPLLKKCQSGKSCFQISKSDPALLGEVEALLRKGLDHYKRIDWV